MDYSIRQLFSTTDTILICDTKGQVMYYEDFNDKINMLRSENVIGRSIFELYPFFQREDFTIFKAIDKGRPILNELQSFIFNGVNMKSLNSAFPLKNDSGIIGGLVMSIDLANSKKKNAKKSYISAKYSFKDIITVNEEFKRRLNTLSMISQNDSNVLITGETGTGKELIAHTIHAESPRREAPLIIQNCAAIPSTLMESILFGTSKGSFTGAIDKIGIFEAAYGGTLFLDEINSMSLELQSKVLRAIETKSIMRIGESTERDVDVRIITSTNEDLQKKVERGEFRADLFYRLNVVSFDIPPLRNRTDDLPALCEHYIKQYNSLFNKQVKGLSTEVKDFFQNYPWPGNVRELKNTIEYALNICKDSQISLIDLPIYMTSVEEIKSPEIPKISLQRSVPHAMKDETLNVQIEHFEREIIDKTYKSCRYNITATAKKLGISRQSLYNKISKYGL